MNQANSQDPLETLLQNVEHIENELRWYASAFELLNSLSVNGSDGPENPDFKGLLEHTHRSLCRTLPFKNSAFYFLDAIESGPTLKYWEPKACEALFQNSIASLINKNSFDWRADWDRTHLYHDEGSGTVLVLEAIATADSFFGVFAGMFDGASSSDISPKALKRFSTVLKNMACVLEGLAGRKLLRQFKAGEVRLPVATPNFETQSSMHDFLTHLPSRTLVEDRLNMALAHARYSGEKVAVLILDVDNFKRVNDFLGIPVGDMLLKNLSERISNCIREEDTLGRMAGNEFILLLPDIHLIQDIEFRVHKIFDRIRVPFHLEGKEIHTSCSMGISIYPDDGENSASLVKSAKAALCQAKEQGKDRYQFFKPSMLSKGYFQMSLEGELRQALERDEFRLYFQPKLAIQTGKVQGMEALLRWQHPKRGLVAPSEFIPIAEEIGLIQPIGEWVLLNACRQIKSWKRAGFPPIRIAVNLSGYQVNHTHWISTVKNIISRTGINPEFLEVEITETVLMDNSDVALSNLQQMNDMGIRISIDDFGTGYSSLSYLKRFPIHSLKIDQSFIRGISERGEGTDAVITKAIVSLAQALNLKTVAEGVERMEEMKYLGSIGCDDIQGYLFSKPRPVDQINDMFTHRLQNPVHTYRPSERKSLAV